MASATFPGNSAYRLDLSTWVSGTTLYGSISVTKTSGSGYWTASAQPWSMNIAGNGFGGSWTYDFRSSTPQTIGITTQAAGVGYGYNTVSASVQMDSGFGTASVSEGQNVSGPPSAPNTPSASSITPVSMTLSWNIPSNNGASIDQMLLRRYNDAGLSTYTDYPQGGGVTSANITGLNPGTTYWWAVYAHNANGYSARSGVLQQATLPSGPPSFTVTPSASGTQAALTFSPPSGASGVTKYTFERRPLPAATPTTSTDSTTNSATVTSLTPGVQYEWRASAWFDTYQSPWTAWTAVQQPNPNVNPGDFFDGNKAATADVTYSWTGTANNSTSRANGRGVDGWEVAPASGAVAVCQQITGGFSGAFSARMVMKVDAAAAGMQLGMANAAGRRAEVVALAQYVGSIYVRPSRAQRLAALIIFTDGAGTPIGSPVVGTAQVVSAGTWTRLSVAGTAPAGAVYAVVRVVDVTGTGWSPWLSGESLDADAAMVTLQNLVDYFDGSTADTTQFAYEWLGTAQASASRRLTLTDGGFDPLQDPDCPAPPAPPVPPSVLDDCIEEIGVWRRYWLAIPADQVNIWIAKLPTITLITGANAERQVRIRYFQNPQNLTPDQLPLDAEWDSEMIVSYMPPLTRITLDGVEELAWASVNGADPLPANRLLYGTGGTPATWPVLSCGSGYLVALDVPLESGAGNLTFEAALTGRML